ncbi:hypothetical protein VHN57_00640 [Sphingobium sp. WW5]|uniref:hypothetical protein n=1 Tax=unclassified Sphingobium TaxID=2611147 RepID=UPI003C16C4FD
MELDDIEAICVPEYDWPTMQNITVVGKAGNGERLCTLKALRWAEPCFDMSQADDLATSFEEHSGFAYDLADYLQKSRRAMVSRHGKPDAVTAGFIGILTIRTEPAAVGNRLGLELIRFLKSLHAGMAWYAGLQAAPYDMERGSSAYKDMRRRLIGYYGSDVDLGFKEDAPRVAPGLMTAFWNQE